MAQSGTVPMPTVEAPSNPDIKPVEAGCVLWLRLVERSSSVGHQADDPGTGAAEAEQIAQSGTVPIPTVEAPSNPDIKPVEAGCVLWLRLVERSSSVGHQAADPGTGAAEAEQIAQSGTVPISMVEAPSNPDIKPIEAGCVFVVALS